MESPTESYAAKVNIKIYAIPCLSELSLFYVNASFIYLLLLFYSTAPSELPKALPLVCRCQNGGICIDETHCNCCPDGANATDCNFQGQYCEIGKIKTSSEGSGTPAAVAVPVILIIIVILTAAGLYVYWRRKAGS